MERPELYRRALGAKPRRRMNWRKRALIIYWDTRFQLGYRIGGFTSARR